MAATTSFPGARGLRGRGSTRPVPLQAFGERGCRPRRDCTKWLDGGSNRAGVARDGTAAEGPVVRDGPARIGEACRWWDASRRDHPAGGWGRGRGPWGRGAVWGGGRRRGGG